MTEITEPSDLFTKPSDVHEYDFDEFHFITKKSHILESSCRPHGESNSCQLCQYRNELCSLPQWPEMIFADNILRIQLKKDKNCAIVFTCLDALRLVDCHQGSSLNYLRPLVKLVDMMTPQPDVKVASSEVWLKSREGQESLKSAIKPFDWTFTTKYKGNVTGFQISKTDERIDLEKLKVHEPIWHYQEVPLFEDELGDNGCSVLSLKFRCMPSGFFILLRFYLRIDNVFVRIYDTRFRWTTGHSFILRDHP